MNTDNDGVNTESGSLALIRQAIENPNCDPDKLSRMLAFRQELEADDAKRIFNAAMHACQAAMPIVVKDTYNDHTHSKFAKLDNVAKRVKPVYIEHGFSITFSEEPCDRPDWLLIIANVRHISNHSETYKRFAPMDDKGPQGGSAKSKLHGCQSTMTYMQRQLLCSIFGVVVSDTDDDGTGGGGAKFITDDQVDQIEKYLSNLPDEKRQGVLDLCQIDSIDQMPPAYFDGVVKKLKLSIDKQDA